MMYLACWRLCCVLLIMTTRHGMVSLDRRVEAFCENVMVLLVTLSCAWLPIAGLAASAMEMDKSLEVAKRGHRDLNDDVELRSV